MTQSVTFIIIRPRALHPVFFFSLSLLVSLSEMNMFVVGGINSGTISDIHLQLHCQ